MQAPPGAAADSAQGFGGVSFQGAPIQHEVFPQGVTSSGAPPAGLPYGYGMGGTVPGAPAPQFSSQGFGQSPSNPSPWAPPTQPQGGPPPQWAQPRMVDFAMPTGMQPQPQYRHMPQGFQTQYQGPPPQATAGAALSQLSAPQNWPPQPQAGFGNGLMANPDLQLQQPNGMETRECTCGKIQTLFTSRKETNPNRQFWKCPDCNYFQWADEPPRAARPAGGPGAPGGQVADGPPCGCGVPSLTLTVKKEGPNTGRQFFKCSTQQCNFFQWADEEPLAPGPPCPCGVPTTQRKVTKESPNKGRPYFACSRGTCQHFAWADEDPAQPRGRSAIATPARAGLGGAGGGFAQSTDVCYKCNQSGHWAKDCTVQAAAPAGGGGNEGRRSDVCFKCQQPGHWGANCPNAPQDFRGIAGGVAPRRGGGRATGAGRGRGGRKSFGGGASFEEPGDFQDGSNYSGPY